MPKSLLRKVLLFVILIALSLVALELFGGGGSVQFDYDGFGF
ncbi:MAG: hypothetical protein ACYSWX_08000 [Planctomycetota bacterium]|jgi:hypothetical protein